MFETKKEALMVVGGLSNTSKMNCMSYGLPAATCPTGQKLRPIEGSTCYDCYGCKGMYRFPVVEAAQYRRLGCLEDDKWVDAMVYLLEPMTHFRWHDVGDLLGQWHLDKIIEVCEQTPGTKHWLPTREAKLIRRNLERIPKNLIVRVSAAMIDGEPPRDFYNTSTVHRGEPAVGFSCPAIDQGGKCEDCRACWDGRRRNISYSFH